MLVQEASLVRLLHYTECRLIGVRQLRRVGPKRGVKSDTGIRHALDLKPNARAVPEVRTR